MILGGGGKDVLFITPTGVDVLPDLRVANKLVVETILVGPPHQPPQPLQSKSSGDAGLPEHHGAVERPLPLDVYQELTKLRNDIDELKSLVASSLPKGP
jgi:hypothetical protein